MNKLVDFPQRQHLEFRKLVFRSVYNTAKRKGIDIESYISSVYTAGENPELFSSPNSLLELYFRFHDLIDSTVSSDPDVNKLSNTDKTYLCFRVYLHNICMGRQSMPESDTELYLRDALKEYFQSAAKVLSFREELKILRYLKRIRQEALSQPG
jgi:hypothetical protein